MSKNSKLVEVKDADLVKVVGGLTGGCGCGVHSGRKK